jgi:putative membrane protein
MFNYLSLLPHLNALLNSTSAVLLLSGYTFIKLGRVKAHRTCQVSAFVTSTVFLVSYLTYHYFHGTTRFAGQGIARPVYFTILFTHTVLAIVVVPLVLITLYRAARGDFVKHRRVARWTFPIWLYVSVTGVVVYLMLYRIYPAL